MREIKFFKIQYWKWKRHDAECLISGIEHKLKFCDPFFRGSLYEREKDKLDKKLNIATSKLKIADDLLKELGLK